MIIPHDIRSIVNPSRIYAKAGEEVSIISVRGEVMICEGVNGRFPYKPEVEYKEPEEKVVIPKPKQTSPAKTSTPITLF